MTVLFSKKAELAIKAMLFLATKEPGTCIDVKVISNALQIPKMFTAKILQELVYAGLVNSKKGKMGGFFLGENGENITIEQIVKTIDGLDIITRCVFGFSQCSEEHPCPGHPYWKSIRNDISMFLNNMTIGKMKDKTIDKLLHL